MLMEQGERMNACPPSIAATFAAFIGLAVLIGGLLAYFMVVYIPRRVLEWRDLRLNYLLPSRPLNVARRKP